jgi:hypothetical protein
LIPWITEVEGQGVELDKVVTIVEQQLEGPISEEVIQEFTEQEAMAPRQIEEARAKIEDFKEELLRPE